MMIAFLAILCVSVAAFAGAPAWAALFGAVALLTISIVEHRTLVPRFNDLGLSHVLLWATWQSAGHAILATAAAYLVGLLARVISGF